MSRDLPIEAQGPVTPRLAARRALVIGAVVLAVAIGVGLALWLGRMLLGAAPADLRTLAVYLTLSGLGSLAAAYFLLWWIDRTRLGSIRTRLLLTPLIAVGVSLLNIFATASLMFFDAHDFRLLVLLQVYALLVALIFAVTVSTGLGGQFDRLVGVARRLAGGDLTARVNLAAGGEVGQLVAAINYLAAELDRAAALQRETDAARRDLLAAISHDLRTPLASMRAMIEAITDDVVTDEATVQRYLLTTRGELGQLSRLIDDLFELARIEAGALTLDREPAALQDLLSDTLEGMRLTAAARGVTLAGDLAGEVRPVALDPAKIQRVLTNLVQNAIRHTPPGGRVHLTAHDLSGYVEVTVRDTGEGIAPEDLPRIFDRFYRGDRARSRGQGGTGLGLAIARGIVEAHGGTIEAASAPGQGSVFRFTLPHGDDGR